MLPLWPRRRTALRIIGKESTNPDKTFSTPCPVPSLLGVESARGSGDAGSGLQSLQLRPHVWIPVCLRSANAMLAGDRTAGDSPILEMELEALKRGSEAGSSGLAGADLAAAIKQQNEVRKDTLASRGNQSSVTAVEADLVWPTHRRPQ